MKRCQKSFTTFFVILVVALGICLGVLAEDGPEGTTTGSSLTSDSPQQIVDNAIQNGGTVTADQVRDAQGLNVNGQPFEMQPGGSVTFEQGGVIQQGNNFVVNGRTYESASGARINQDGSLSGNFVEARPPTPPVPSRPSLPSDAVIDGAVRANGVEGFLPTDTGYEVESAETIEQGDMKISDAVNVVRKNNIVCGESASSIILGSSIHTKADGFCLDSHTVTVKNAEDVTVRCGGNGASLHSSSVRDATVEFGMYIQMNSSTEQDVDITDCAGTEMRVTFKGNDSKAEFERDGQEVHLTHANVVLNVSDGFIAQEVAQANGTASLIFDKTTGLVQWVDMNPTFSYEFRTGDIRKDFAFKAQGGKHLLWIHRKTGEFYYPEAKTCIFCSFVDMPEHVITVKSGL